MPKAKFIGDPNDDFSGPSIMTLWGYSFPKGEYIEISDTVANKVRTHNHFAVEGEEGETAEKAAVDAMSLDEIRDALDRAGVEYRNNMGRPALTKLYVDNNVGNVVEPESE